MTSVVQGASNTEYVGRHRRRGRRGVAWAALITLAMFRR